MGINIVDILMAMSVAAVIFIGRKEGIVAGIFKLFGIFCSTFVALHYYVRFADFLRVQFFNKDTETEFFAFCLLAIPLVAAFIVICNGWVLILKLKLFALIDRSGGIILALIRSYYVCGLLFFAIVLSGQNFAVPQARSAVSRILFNNVSVGLYEKTYASLIQKFFPHEDMNTHPFWLVSENLDQKNNKKH